MLNSSDGQGDELGPAFGGDPGRCEKPPPGAKDDWTVPQNWEAFTPEEHEVWNLLFDRQQQALAGRAVRSFERGLELLGLGQNGIPSFDELNERLSAATGWRVVAVPGLVPDDVFHDHLARRQFPAGNFIRTRGQLDYLEEPDVFHDVFGHVPMLADPAMADWVQRLGSFGRDASTTGTLSLLARLYWRTVEFGLIEEDGELRILGAGILSSLAESRYALESDEPRREPFSLRRVLSQPYRSDRFQDLYFVVSDLDALVEHTKILGWTGILELGAVDE